MATRWQALRWGWLGLGAIALALGVLLGVTAHAVHPVEFGGTISDYAMVTSGEGAYDHNELRLGGDLHRYVVNGPAFHPPLPAKLYLDGRVNIWVDQGTTSVIAMLLFDQHDQNPTLYATDAYDHPEQPAQNSRLVGGVVGGGALALLLLGLLWPRLLRRRPQDDEWQRWDRRAGRGQGPRRAAYPPARGALDRGRYRRAPDDPDADDEQPDDWDADWDAPDEEPYGRRARARVPAPYARTRQGQRGRQPPPGRSQRPDRWDAEPRDRRRPR
jgi:hypothetical protein